MNVIITLREARVSITITAQSEDLVATVLGEWMAERRVIRLRDRSSGELRLINLARLDDVTVQASHSVSLVPAGWTQASFDEVARIPHSTPR
jgi:hypothetical protein